MGVRANRGADGWIKPSAWLFQGTDSMPAVAGGRVNQASIVEILGSLFAPERAVFFIYTLPVQLLVPPCPLYKVGQEGTNRRNLEKSGAHCC